jgi:transcriptional regulator with XRE-family HTH domain
MKVKHMENQRQKKSFAQLLSEAKTRDSYWVARAIATFTEELHQLAEQQQISRADLARLLGTSPAYITKIFRGNVNFTVDTMVRLARALGGQLHLHVGRQDHEVMWLEASPVLRPKAFPDSGADEYRTVPKIQYEEPLQAEKAKKTSIVPRQPSPKKRKPRKSPAT